MLVVFTEQLFAALVSSGGNSSLAVATLDDGDLIVWTCLLYTSFARELVLNRLKHKITVYAATDQIAV